MSDWGEIRRLQAELERVQSSSTAFKLSEANCVEIVRKLTEMNLLTVLFTLDGKEYVHPDYLEREIMNELEANNGRVEITGLQQVLNVDLHHIQKGVENLLRCNSDLEKISGDLINSSYKIDMCHEINELLLQSGFVALSDLSTTFQLPLDFITKCIESNINTLIKGKLDKSGSGLLYTESYVSRHKSRLRGVFSAVTRPTLVVPILTEGKYNERLFYSVLHELISSGEVSGNIHGRGSRALFIPTVYTQLQSQWVDSFLNDNGYLEYDTLVRLGIDDPQSYIHNKYKKSDDLIMLKTCCVGSSVLSEITANVEDIVLSQLKWIDIMTVLPAPCMNEDGEILLQKLYSNQDQFFLSEVILAHKEFLKTLLESFQDLISERAKKAAATSSSFLRQVSTEGGGGGKGKRGGKQKKGGKREKEDSEASDNWNIIFMSKKEIEETLLEQEDIPNELAEALSHSFHKPLQERFEAAARLMLAERAEGEAGSQRKRHSELQNSIQEMWNRVKLFEKGIELFEDDLKIQLSRYLLRSICTDMVNTVVRYLSVDYKLTTSEDSDTFNKERVKVINRFPDTVKKVMLAVNSSLSNKETTAFVLAFEELCEMDTCGIMLRKLDKKKEKLLIHTHCEGLRSSLQQEQDPAMALHLITVLLFQKHTNCLIHTPGRLLPQIISFLRSYMSPGDYAKLNNYQSLVVLELKQMSSTPQIPVSEGSMSDSNMETSLTTPLTDNDKQKDEVKEKDSTSLLQEGGEPNIDIDSQIFEEEALLIDDKELLKEEPLVEGSSEEKEKNSEEKEKNSEEKEKSSEASSFDVKEQLLLMINEVKDLVLKSHGATK